MVPCERALTRLVSLARVQNVWRLDPVSLAESIALSTVHKDTSLFQMEKISGRDMFRVVDFSAFEALDRTYGRPT